MRTKITILSFPLALAAVVAGLWPARVLAQRQVDPARRIEMAAQAAGAVAEMDDRAMAIRPAGAESVRYRYRYTNATRWVNDAGDFVSRQSVRPGASVTVQYRRGVDGWEA